MRSQLIGELHDQDAVLGDETHQRDEPDLAVDVERAPGKGERDQRPRHGERYRQHDHQRRDEALELGGQNEINEYQCKQEGDVDRARGLPELARHPLEVELCGGPHHVAGVSLQCVEGFAEGVAVPDACRDAARTETIEVVELSRSDGLAHFHEVRELNHLAVFTAHID